MLVDQDDTPLFLGAIHRILRGVRLEDLESAAGGPGWTFRRNASDAAITLLDPTTLVLTDGQGWATVTLEVPPGLHRRGRCCTPRSCRAWRRRRPR